MNLIRKYFPDLTTVQLEQFTQLATLYEEWNQKINVISRKDVAALYERHILHSLGIAIVFPFPDGAKILDIGTGGGFPGIPLAILYPACDFHLVDSIGKKITVVNAVKDSIGLKNVIAEQKRAEEVQGKYHFIVSRAVTKLSTLTSWTKDKFFKDPINQSFDNGWLCLKGGDLAQEIQELQYTVRVFELKNYFEETFFETKKVVFVQWR